MTDSSAQVTTVASVPVSMPLWDMLNTFKRTPFPADYPAQIRRFYAPEDQSHLAIKALISSATSSLLISMYGFDDPELTSIIINLASNPAIYVMINLDSSQASGSAEKDLVAQLCASPNTRVAVGQSADHRINHLKMAVVDGLYTLTGSMNWSADGQSKQNNEASVIMDRAVAHEAAMKLTSDHAIMQDQMTAKGSK